MYDEIIANSIVTIDLKKVKENIRKIKAHIGDEVTFMPVLKANACGHGLVETGKYLTEECGIDILGVSVTKEAQLLRNAGIKTEIMVIAGIPFNNVNYIIEENLITPVYNKEYAQLLSDKSIANGKVSRVHLKIDTGLGRLGVREHELVEFIELLKSLKGIKVEGIYTHFGEAEILSKDFTYTQMKRFDDMVKTAQDMGLSFKYIHACNTPATVRFKDAHYNLVRCGLLWLGYDPSEDSDNILGLERTLNWETFVTSIKDIKAGEVVGYVRQYTAKRDTKLAVLSIGYGDGYLEDLKKNGEVIYNGKMVPIVAINMDQMVIDATDIPEIQINDMVTLIGYNGDKEINGFHLEKKTWNSYVFYLCNIGERPHKIYFQ